MIEKERETEWVWAKGKRGRGGGKKTMKRLKMTSSDSPESQWGSLKSKYTHLAILTANIKAYFYSEPSLAHIRVRSAFQDVFVRCLSVCHSVISLTYAIIFSIYDCLTPFTLKVVCTAGARCALWVMWADGRLILNGRVSRASAP